MGGRGGSEATFPCLANLPPPLPLARPLRPGDAQVRCCQCPPARAARCRTRVGGVLERRTFGSLAALVSTRMVDEGFLVAFTERSGGTSEGPFASLNLGFKT